MFDIKSYLARKSALINRELEKRLPAENIRPAILHRAMRYSVLAGGKRLRPILCLAAAEAVGGKEKHALVPALAIEILHTYTLIHDDLPCMDDDNLRRGKPTSHVVFGEANAILAGDALLTLAFEWLVGTVPPKPYMPNHLILELAGGAGNKGVIAGQVEDLASERKKPNAVTVHYIHMHKTACLIIAAVRIGGICGGARKNELSALSNFGEKAGFAFQIADDILNETSSREKMGKAAGSDRSRGKMTYVAVHGLEKAKKMVRRLAEEAVKSLQSLKGNTEPLKMIVEYIVARKK
ncbi:MAG: polyprenyl synthetase family protein [Kiritimatiellia bacterium]|nr:polyprenyl synthetase family protein [Kiritimatiellia bacterium]